MCVRVHASTRWVKAGEREGAQTGVSDGVQEFSPFKRNEEYQSILSKGRVSVCSS